MTSGDPRKAQGCRCESVVAPAEVDSGGYGEKSEQKYLTCLFEDPDGIIVQLNQRVS